MGSCATRIGRTGRGQPPVVSQEHRALERRRKSTTSTKVGLLSSGQRYALVRSPRSYRGADVGRVPARPWNRAPVKSEAFGAGGGLERWRTRRGRVETYFRGGRTNTRAPRTNTFGRAERGYCRRQEGAFRSRGCRTTCGGAGPNP